MTGDTEKNRPSGLSKFNLFLVLIVGLLATVHVIQHDQTNYAPIDPTVDFSVSHIQQLKDGFMLTNAGQKKHLTGVKFSGRIINTLAVDHHNVTFQLHVDGKNKEFSINRISSGRSTSFNVYVPELELEYARYAQIGFVRSKVSYRN